MEPAPDPETPHARPARRHPVPPLKRILVVDDSAPMRAILRTMLRTDKSSTWEIVEAANASEFQDAISSRAPFDMVLLDVQMPDLNGFAACRSLRERDRNVPVVFVTSEADLGSFGEGRSAGGDSYLVKPFSPAALKAALHALTNVRRREGVSPAAALQACEEPA